MISVKVDRRVLLRRRGIAPGRLAAAALLVWLGLVPLRLQPPDEGTSAPDASTSAEAEDERLYHLGVQQALDDPKGAIATLTQAVDLNANRAAQVAPLLGVLAARAADEPELFYLKLGVTYLQMGEIPLAEAALERAVAINPAYGEATAYLAYVRARLGKPALGAAQQALALDPANPTVYYLVGLTWKQIRRPVEARLALERGYELDPTNPAFPIEIAEAHRAERQYALAELWMREALRLTPQDFHLRLLLAQFYVDTEYRVSEEGLPLAQALVAEQPENAEAHATLGWAYFLSGEVGRAFEEMDRALALDPSLPRANAHMGALLESQERMAEAMSYYERAKTLDPSGPFGALATQALERIAGQ